MSLLFVLLAAGAVWTGALVLGVALCAAAGQGDRALGYKRTSLEDELQALRTRPGRFTRRPTPQVGL